MARAKLGEILIQQGVIDASALKLALGAQIRFASQRMKIGQVLVDMGACTPEHVARALGTQMGVPYTDLTTAKPAALALLPVELSIKHQAIAIAAEAGPPEVVHVAFAEPLDLAAVDAVRSRLGKRIKAFIASPEAIAGKLASLGSGAAEAGEFPSERVDLGDVLFGDEGGGTMAVEHDEPGQVRVPNAVQMADERSVDVGLGDGSDDLFGRGGTPIPVAMMGRGDTPAPAVPAPSGAADFDALFGSDGAPPASSAEGSPVLEGTDSVVVEDAGPPPTPVAVHHFPDHRVKVKPVPPPPPPDEEEDVPLQDVSGEAFFGEEPAAEEPAAAPLLGTDFGEAPVDHTSHTVTEPVGPAPAPDLSLFGSAAAHAAEHETSGDAVPHDPTHRDALFGGPDDHVPMPSISEAVELPEADLLAFKAPLPEVGLDPEPPAAPSALAPDSGEWVEAVPASEPAAAVDAAPEPSPALPEPTAAVSPAEPPPVEDEQLDVEFAEVEPEPAAPAAAAPALAMSTATLRPAPKPLDLNPPTVLGRPATLAPQPRPPTAEPPAANSVTTQEAAVARTQVAIEPVVESLASFADRPLTDAELEVITAIEHLADGGDDAPAVKQVKPAQMVAALVRLLIRQGVIQETDFLAELSRK